MFTPNFAKRKRMKQADDSSPAPSSSACEIQISRGFAKSFPPENSLAKPSPHCSATCPNTWRAEHQRKMSFPLSRKNSPPPNQESKRHFSLVFPSEARQWRNDTSVRFSFKPPRTRGVRISPFVVQKRFEQSRAIQHNS